MKDFETHLRGLLNTASLDNAWNTPDYITCLAAFHKAVEQRDALHGRAARPTSPE